MILPSEGMPSVRRPGVQKAPLGTVPVLKAPTAAPPPLGQPSAPASPVQRAPQPLNRPLASPPANQPLPEPEAPRPVSGGQPVLRTAPTSEPAAPAPPPKPLSYGEQPGTATAQPFQGIQTVYAPSAQPQGLTPSPLPPVEGDPAPTAGTVAQGAGATGLQPFQGIQPVSPGMGTTGPQPQGLNLGAGMQPMDAPRSLGVTSTPGIQPFGTASQPELYGGGAQRGFQLPLQQYPTVYLDSQFDVSKNLRSSQFNPNASENLSGVQGMTNRLAQGVGGFNGLSPFQSVNPYGDAYTGRADRLYGEAESLGRTGIGEQQQIAGTDLSGAYGSLGRAESLVNGATGTSGESDAARRYASEALGSLNGAPSRAQLAADAFDLIQQRGAPQYEQELRGVGKRAAALGRIGAGMTTNELTDVFSQRQRDLDLTRRELANSAAGMELSDRTNRLSSSLGAMGAFGGEDRAGASLGLNRASALGSLAGMRGDFAQVTRRDAESDRNYGFNYGQANASNALSRGNFLAGLGQTAFGQGQSMRNEARGERDARDQHDIADLGARSSALGSLGNLESMRYGQDVGGRNEMRTERDYQNTLANQATENRFRAAQLQDSLLNSSSARNNDQIRLLLAAMGDPSSYAGMLMNASAQQGQAAQGGFSDIGNLLSLYYANQGTNPQQQPAQNRPLPNTGVTPPGLPPIRF